MLRTLVRDTLGLRVAAECRDVKGGLEACRRERPDLVILDWNLPDGTGADLIRALASEPANGAGPRWLAISMTESSALVRAAAELGVQGFVLKTSDLDTFQAAVLAVLAGETFFCPRSLRLWRDAMQAGAGRLRGEGLTARELEILGHYARGLNPKEIADRFGVSAKTVQNQLSTMKEKLGLAEPAALVRHAQRLGLA